MTAGGRGSIRELHQVGNDIGGDLIWTFPDSGRRRFLAE